MTAAGGGARAFIIAVVHPLVQRAATWATGAGGAKVREHGPCSREDSEQTSVTRDERVRSAEQGRPTRPGLAGRQEATLSPPMPPGLLEAAPGGRKTSHECPVPVGSPLSRCPHRPVPLPTPLSCSRPLLLLLPTGLWLSLPSVHDGRSDRLSLPHTKRTGRAKPRVIMLHSEPRLS